MKHPRRLFSATLFLVAFVALSAAPGAPVFAQGASVTLADVHGLTYSPDGKSLLVAHHHGIAVYAAGKWTRSPGPQHDYMGFSATKDSFYSSGHPGPGSGFANPLGLMSSNDGGRSWTKLSLEREADFHLLAASYNTGAIYVYSPVPNSRMRSAGFYYTLNNGSAWKQARAIGFGDKPSGLAVHPDDPKVVAIASKSGFYLSTDSGNSFRVITKGAQALAAFFDLDGEHLWLSSYAGAPALARANLKTGTKNAVMLPPLTRDAVAYIAQNPVSRNEYAIVTFERSVFLTTNMGQSWTQIALNGRAK